jgi:hypothetical protein
MMVFCIVSRSAAGPAERRRSMGSRRSRYTVSAICVTAEASQ